MDWLASHVWDTTEEFCEVYPMLNPAEPGQRVFAADEEDYTEYERMRQELGLE